MSDLQKGLDRAATGATRSVDVAELWEAAQKRSQRTRYIALMGVVVAAGLAWSATQIDWARQGRGSIAGERGSEGEISREATPEKAGRYGTCSQESVECISLDRPWSIVGYGFGTAWVGNVGEGASFGVVRFAPTSDREMARLPTDGFVQAFTSDDRWMWMLLEAGNDQRSLLKVDPDRTEVVAEYDLGSAGNIGGSSMVSDGKAVWVAGPRATLTRVSADDGARSDFSYRRELPAYGRDHGPVQLAFGEGRLWMSYGQGHLALVDPTNGELIEVRRDALSVNAYELVVAHGFVWSPFQTPVGENVLGYAPIDGGAGGQVSLAEATPIGAGSDDSTIWVVQQGFGRSEPSLLVAVDPDTREVVGDAVKLDIEFDTNVVTGDGYVWVTGRNVLYRIDA